MRRPSWTTIVVGALYVVVAALLALVLATLFRLTAEVEETRAEAAERARQRDVLAADIETLRDQLLELGQQPEAGPPSESIAGPRGPQGEPGQTIVGPQGPAGATVVGPQGPAGASIIGPQGPAGRDGRDGADSTVPGPQGEKGDPGADSTVPGPQGPQGQTGGHPETFVFTDSLGREFTCTDPDGDGRYECAQTGGPGPPP